MPKPSHSSLLLLLGALLLSTPCKAGDHPFRERYDRVRHVGELLVPGPDREPRVVRRRKGLQVVEFLPLHRGELQATLVLWAGYPNGRALYPELWTRSGDTVRRVWPANPHLEWGDARVDTRENQGNRQAVVTRRLPSTRLDAPPVHTREVFSTHPEGLELVSKTYSRWSTPEQLLSVVVDLLVTSQGQRIRPLLAAYQERRGPLGPKLRDRLEQTLDQYLTRAEAPAVKKERR